ncbi:MAG: hypothetical protein IJO50_01955 [Clostridia bacterium]|nr:hypothetical protein [Clostridia bacterium]
MKKKRIFWIFLLLVLFAFAWELYDRATCVQPVSVTLADLSSYAGKEVLTDRDYEFLFLQTGLGKPAVDALRKHPETCADELSLFQKQLADYSGYERNYLFFPTTTAETLQNAEKRPVKMALPPLEKGDILITGSTKTLLLRHGHSAIVTDSSGEMIEAMMLGTSSARSDAKLWSSYATLMILRPKVEQSIKDRAVAFAEEKLLDVPYSLLAGLGTKDVSQQEKIESTHCSHLVWQAYKAAGLDLDANGGIFVLPKDIAGSGDLELVFAYGFGEDGKW